MRRPVDEASAMTDLANPHPKPAKPPFFLRQWRKRRGYTQEELAEIVGVTPSTISQLENRKQGFTDTTLFALAEALHCHPADLLLRDPLDNDAPWTIWDNVKKAPPERRQMIVAAVESMLKTGTDG